MEHSTRTRFSSRLVFLAALAGVHAAALAQSSTTPMGSGSSADMPNGPSSVSPSPAPSTSTNPSPSGSTYNSSPSTTDMQPYGPTSAGTSSYASGSSAYYDSNRYSWMPFTTSGYVGFGLGNGKLNTTCVAGLECADPDGAFHIYTGGMFSQWAGIELGYTQLDGADRNGGTTKVKGLSLLLTAGVPLGDYFDAHIKAGGTYGWTKVTAAAGVPIATGSENGFGWSYGAGLAWNFSRNWGLTVDWDRHHLKFVGDDKQDVDVATLGLRYRF